MAVNQKPQADYERDSKTSSTTDLFDLKSPVSVSEKARDDSLVDEDPTPFRWTNWFLRRPVQKYDPDAISTRRSVYDDPALAEYFWPKTSYEIDPDARWTYENGKIDWKVMLWAAVSFSALNLDFRFAH